MTDEVKNENVEEVKEEESSVSPIEEAKDVLAKISQENKVMEANLDRAEKLKAHDMVSGKGAAGETPKKDENAGAKSLLAGTGYDEQLFPDQ